MKRTGALLLIGVFLLKVAGIQGLYLAEEWVHEAHMKQELRKECPEILTVIDAASTGLVIEGEDEIEINGEMYDVVKRDGRKIYCVNDSKEDALIQKRAAASQEEKKQQAQLTEKQVMQECHDPVALCVYETATRKSISNQYIISPLQQLFSEITSPPPEQVFFKVV